MNNSTAQPIRQGAAEGSPSLAARAKGLVEARLKSCVDEWPGTSGRLSMAAGQALLAPGKRVRSVLLCLIAADGDAIPAAAIDTGCAIEMVHTASLILDDLPCMDNATTRRSRASTHVAFGQATAILAAIALLTKAFELIGTLRDVSHQDRVELGNVLAATIGLGGLSAGQDIDVNDRWAFQTVEEIEHLNWLKTGILFSAAAEMGAMMRRIEGAKLVEVRCFARHLGQAFQTLDDLLDRRAGAHDAGKDVGKDRGFATMVSLLGEMSAQADCADRILRAQMALERSGVPAQPVLSYVETLLAGRTVVDP